MGHDDEFVEYVELRWSLLYRFAVALVGEPEADELTRSGLVAAYDAWPEVVASGSRDVFVEQLVLDGLVARAREDVPAAIPVPTPPDAETLDARLARLPLLQRVVLGLRYETEHRDPGAALDLGLAAADEDRLRAEALVAVLGPDQTEDDLVAELRRQVDDILPPLPPVEEILDQAHQAAARRRRRHASITGSVVAVVLGASVLVSATDPDRGTPASTTRAEVPSRMSEVPTARPRRATYSVGNVLDLGRTEVTLPGAPTTLATAGSDLVIAYPDGRIELFDTATRSRALLADRSVGDPVVDPDGSWVAWQVPGQRPGVVVAVSLIGQESHQRGFPVMTTCCDGRVLLHGITGAGQLVATVPADGTSWVWDLEGLDGPGPLRRLEGLGRLVVTRVAGDQVVTVDPSAPALGAVVGTLDGDTFESRFSTDRREPDFTVPGWIVYTAWDGTVRARSLPWAPPASGSRPREVTLGLPPDLIRTTLRHELGTSVVMDVRPLSEQDPLSGYLVRCDLATGACQNLARLAGPHHLAR